MHAPPAHTQRRRPGWFTPVPVRARSDGWSVARQCRFLAALYWTGSVRAAAAAVGMSRASAYRLRGRADAAGFAAAWDRVLTPPGSGRLAGPRFDYRKVTQAALAKRAGSGLVRPVLYRGTLVAISRKPDNSALLRLLSRSGAIQRRVCARVARRSPQSFARPPGHCHPERPAPAAKPVADPSTNVFWVALTALVRVVVVR